MKTIKEFEDRLTVTYMENATLEVQALYATFIEQLEQLGGKVTIEEIAFTEHEGE